MTWQELLGVSFVVAIYALLALAGVLADREKERAADDQASPKQ